MFLHTLNPQPLIFQFGFLKIHWYGLVIAIAVSIGLIVAIKLNQKYKEKNIIVFKNKDQILDLCFYLVIFGLVGARIYEVFLFFPFYLKDPLAIFKIWNGGLAIHGVILAGILTVIIFARKHKTDLYLSLDLLVPALTLGQAIGRWGNYFNQELFGLPTNLSWGIPIDLAHRPIGYENFSFFHPTFLYESLLSFALAGVLIFLHCRRLAKLDATQRCPTPKGVSDTCATPSPRGSLSAEDSREELQYGQNTKSYQKGNIVLIYLIGYSLIRFSLEFIKIDETPLALGLRWPQAVSLVLIAAAGVFLFKNTKRNNTVK
ncbi:MAG: prolipoprotein diacylglyceryl transferase [bacterium]